MHSYLFGKNLTVGNYIHILKGGDTKIIEYVRGYILVLMVWCNLLVYII